MIKKLSALFALNILLVSVSIAAPTDSSIKLPVSNGGVLKPNQTVSVVLDGLQQNVFYNVNCKIDNTASQDVAVKFDLTGGAVVIQGMTLNGQSIAFSQAAVKKNLTNVLKLNHLVTYVTTGSLTMMNLDQDSALRVYDCIAQPAV